MAFQQSQELSQKQSLSQAMQHSLMLLQLPAAELQSYIDKALVENPMLESLPPESSPSPRTGPADSGLPTIQTVYGSHSVYHVPSEEATDLFGRLAQEESYTDHLLAQLGERADLDKRMLSLCRYLVGCLNASGYLDCPLRELAQEANVSLFELEQALFVVQELEPLGTGARSLSECLLLQLAQSRHFNELSIRMVSIGLDLLARKDYDRLAGLLRASPDDVRRTAAVIQQLNPIPSRGFGAEAPTAYIVPEATVSREGETLLLEINNAEAPQLSIHPYYQKLLEEDGHPEVREYLQGYLQQARNVIAELDNRRQTMETLLVYIIRDQAGFFLRKDTLQPMTMSHLAQEMHVSTSTVSRAVKDKYILFDGELLPLRHFFSVPIRTEEGPLSPDAVKARIMHFISLEPSDRPLSDEALAASLSGSGIRVSRRTVAKYRSEEGIPTAAQRRKDRRASDAKKESL